MFLKRLIDDELTNLKYDFYFTLHSKQMKFDKVKFTEKFFLRITKNNLHIKIDNPKKVFKKFLVRDNES